MQSSCNLCGSSNVVDVLSIESVPVFCNVLFETPTQAKECTKGNLLIQHCSDCDHLFNGAFDPGILDYDMSYDASLDFSPRFQKYAEDLADKIIQDHQLENKTVVEIACGKGRFLHGLSQKAENRYVGYDPSFEQGPGDYDNVEIFASYYKPGEIVGESGEGKVSADFLICRHALEHIEKPTEFLQQTLMASAEKGEALEAYFEVPNSLFMVRDKSVWDFIYEHVSYFSPASLSRVFRDAGMDVLQCYESYEGQFIGLHATNKNQPDSRLAEKGYMDMKSGEYIDELQQHYNAILLRWTEFFKAEDVSAVLWGAGSKGVSFLNSVPGSEKLSAVIDLNPHKHGKFVPGTAHEILHPDCLKQVKPKTVIIMNPIYKEEIEQSLVRLGVSATVLVV